MSKRFEICISERAQELKRLELLSPLGLLRRLPVWFGVLKILHVMLILPCSGHPLVEKGLKNVRRALLDQAKGPSSPASFTSQWPHQMPLGAYETIRYLSPDNLPLHLAF